MSDLESLLLILAVLYASETVVWLRREVTAFRQFWPGRWRALRGHDAPEGRPGFFFWLNPLPPLGTVLLCPDSALAFSSRGITSTKRKPDEEMRIRDKSHLDFEEIRQVSADDDELWVNGRILLRRIPSAEATRLAGVIQKLAGMPAAEREPAIETERWRQWDRKQAGAILKKYRETSSSLRWYCNIAFLYLFVAVPALVAWRGLAAVWLPLLLAMVACSGLVAVEFRRARRALAGPGAASWLDTVTILLSPLAAIRAGDALSKPVLAGFHPLVVANQLLSHTEYEELAGQAVRESRYPLDKVLAGTEPMAAATSDEFQERQRKSLEEFVAQTAGPLEGFLSPPVPHPGCRSFCPRCRDQYMVDQGVCSDCPGVPLQPFPPTVRESAPETKPAA